MRRAILILTLALLPAVVLGQERNPPPDFESGYELPKIQVPAPRPAAMEYVDMAALVLALAGASYIALRLRSRRAMAVLMLACLAYFGFFRQGCICPIGAIQNVALGLFSSGYVVPLTAVIFLVLPLLFALFAGRTFCSSVCPLGAVQDAVAIRPVKVPNFLEHALGLIPFVYLAAAVLLAATGSAFLICAYDPFVAFFRLQGSLDMVILGVLTLIVGLFVARPYCRFGCPLGAMLRLLSPLSCKHATITPTQCINCRMCEDICPFNAIEKPTPPVPPRQRFAGKHVLALLLALVPVLVAGGAVLGHNLGGVAAESNATWRLAKDVAADAMARAEGTPSPLEGNKNATNAVKAFRASGRTMDDLFAEAASIRGRLDVGSAIAGGFIGLVLGLKLVDVSIRRRRVQYEIVRSRCVSCGRCFEVCPVEQLRRQGKSLPPDAGAIGRGEGR